MLNKNRKLEANVITKLIYLIAFLSLLTLSATCFQTYMSYKYFRRDFNIGIVEKININTAGVKELQLLSTIGKKTAEKIIEGRPYQTLDEIYERGYICTKTFNNIKNKIDI